MKATDRLNYWFLKLLLYPLSLLPLRCLYLLADVVAWLARVPVGYRRKVVRENLSSAFPDKSVAELRRIEKGFYQFLADYGVETVKMLTMSDSYIKRHMIIENPGPIAEALERGRNVTLFLGHYCNWEWVSSLPLHFPPQAISAQVYHPLHNKGMDRLFMTIRTRFHAHNIAMKDILRSLITWKRAGTPSVTGYIADQAPGLNYHLFLNFLNHKTGVFTGPERISRFLDAEVWYCHMERPRRGYYRLRFVPVTMQPKSVPQFDITRRCFDLLQQNIRQAPQYYLWSHRRWKHTEEEFYEYWGDKAQEQLSHL